MASVQLIAQTPDMTTAVVTFDGRYRTITTITHASHIVVYWINDVIRSYAPPAGANGRAGVGLHVEWSPLNGTTALLELCVGNKCLVYQLQHRNDASPPVRLNEFLSDDRFCFTGVAVLLAMFALWLEHGLTVQAAIDLGDKASRRLQREDLRSAGLDRLASEVLGIEMIRPDEAQRSALLERVLHPEHVALACVNAVFFPEVGRILLSK